MGRKFKTTYQRGVVGKVFLALACVFHIFWVGCIVFGIAASNPDLVQDLNQAERDEMAIGSMAMIFLYPVGAFFFWFLVRVTRGPAITEELE